jgi:hypothetical protein
MKSSMMKLASVSIAVSLLAATAACGGGLAEGKVATTSSPTGSASVAVQLGLPKVGNPKYDQFFTDVVELAELVAEARDALETAPATLNKAMHVTEATDFETAVKSVHGKLDGKVVLAIDVGPTGANVSAVAAPGVTLSPEDQDLMEAYKRVVIDVAAVPIKLAPVVPKSISIVAQGVSLAASAKSDFSGMQLFTTLPSVIVGIGKVTAAMTKIKNDVPVIIDKSQTMTVAIKGAV